MCLSYFTFQKKTITLHLAKDKTIMMNVEIADNSYKHMIGYMFRDEIEENEGMLFIFNEAARRSFWMVNVKFPLEAIFFSANGTVVDVLEMESGNKGCRIYTSQKEAKYVLEVPKGFSQKNGITINNSKLVLDSIKK